MALSPTPPAGTWDFEDGVSRRIGASTRSWWVFFFLPILCALFGACLWTYGSQIASGTFDPLRTLFGIPLTFATVWLGCAVVMLIGGKVEIQIRGTQGQVFSGIGRLGRTCRFSTTEFTRIREDRYAWWWSRDGKIRFGPKNPPIVIILEGSRRMNIGRGLNNVRRRFMIESLRPLIGPRA